ncbi:glycosyl hydrolase family 95 catalytic domain-containing protein [Streptomyces sp. TLI_171]|uniref:glycosyl hydrolase family 95 catalytic domain-containing protein n=1 Tax=Streptomyces sp. TLI_171 TaxID=1938859 RepID=UPI000C175103|nr:glycoside hydrolase N-terminal domain-containing protein [Streptomyces sp. TLI_171]RKE17113.1 glycosyl hydrolase family 65 [Streptomyces sp. TLI_171]
MNGARRRGSWEPAPAARWEDALLTGNGRHGAMVHGDGVDERIVVNHHLLVRPNGGERARAPQLAEELEQLRDEVLAGRARAAVAPHIGPLQWVRPFHPAFAVRLRRSGPVPGGDRREVGPRLAADYRREVDYRTGVVTVRPGGQQTFVSRADDLVVHRESGAAAIEVSHDWHLPGAPDGADVSTVAEHRPDGGAVLRTDVRYPGDSGFGYTGRTHLRPTGGTLRIDGATVRAEGCAELLLLTRIHPWEDGGLPEPPPDLAFDELLDRHCALHTTAYDRVTLDLDAPEEHRALPGSALLADPTAHQAALLERLFDAGRYHLLSASGILPPRLTGIWTGSWDTAWSGALTCDANLNLQIAAAAVAALPEVSAAHAAFVARQLDDWRANATRLFGLPGLVAPAHTDGRSGHAYHYSEDYPLHLWTAGAHWLLHPLLDHLAVTEDPALAEQLVRPALAETAAFYRAFLTRTDADGRLLLVPSYSPENTPLAADSPISVNAAMDLAAARHTLTATGHHQLADRLPPYRINSRGALAEWAWPGAEDNQQHRHLSHLHPVWPLDEINPLDTPALADAAHRALQLRGSENHSAHGHLHRALIAARLGDPDLLGEALDAVLHGAYFHPSLMSSHYPRLDVYNADAAHTLPGVLIEALLQSTPERIVLLPAPPPHLPHGTVRGLRTRCRVTVAELSWNLTERQLTVRLSSETDRTVTVHLGADPDRPPQRLALRAGQDTPLHLELPRS